MNSDFWKSTVNRWINVVTSDDEEGMRTFIETLGGSKTEKVKKEHGTILDAILDDEEDEV